MLPSSSARRELLIVESPTKRAELERWSRILAWRQSFQAATASASVVTRKKDRGKGRRKAALLALSSRMHRGDLELAAIGSWTTYAEKCLDLGQKSPKVILGMVAAVAPQLLEHSKHVELRKLESVVDECDVRVRTPIGDLACHARRARVHAQFGDEDLHGIVIPDLSPMMAGTGSTINDAMSDWVKQFEESFRQTYDRVVRGCEERDEDWNSWCSQFRLRVFPISSFDGLSRVVMLDREIILNYFGKVVSASDSSIRVRWLHADQDVELVGVPGVSEVRRLGNEAWFASRVVQRLQDDKIVRIIDVVPADPPRKGGLSESEEQSLLARFTKTVPGLRKGNLTDRK